MAGLDRPPPGEATTPTAEVEKSASGRLDEYQYRRKGLAVAAVIRRSLHRLRAQLAIRAGRWSLMVVCGLLVAFAVGVCRSSLVGLETGAAAAWLSGLAAVVAAGMAVPVFLRRGHVWRRVRGERPPSWGAAVPHPHPETAPRHVWYRGRSHSGERPRFD